jgi:hypothetical protein
VLLFGPVGEGVFVEFAFEVFEALVEAGGGVGDALVVDEGSDVGEEEVEQESGCEVAEGFGEVALLADGGDGVGAVFFGEFDHRGPRRK